MKILLIHLTHKQPINAPSENRVISAAVNLWPGLGTNCLEVCWRLWDAVLIRGYMLAFYRTDV